MGFAALLAVVGLGAGAAPITLYIERPPTTAELRTLNTGAKHEPAQGALLGAYIDLDSTNTDLYKDSTGINRRMPDAFERQTGRQHATYFFYLGYGRPAPEDWITLLGMQGRVVHIALEPNNGLELVRDDAYLRRLAASLANTKTPILLRFASEMNGDWLAWNGNPELYKEKWRLVTRVMREMAPNVAMVWCPYATPVRNIDDYYPGDEWVDWVGVNIYNVTYFNQNRKTPARQVGPTELLDPVYERYAARKPIMIGEYGATHYSRVEDRSVPEFAIGCIRSLYSALPRRYPRVKAVVYFNTNNMDLAHARNNNYAVTQHPRVLQVYREKIASPWFLSRMPAPGAAPMPQPMPLRTDERVSGTITLSSWAPFHQGDLNLRLRVGGRIVFEAPDASGWETRLDTTTLPNGRVSVVAETRNGRRVVSRARGTLLVQN